MSPILVVVLLVLGGVGQGGLLQKWRGKRGEVRANDRLDLFIFLTGETDVL